MSDTIPAAQDEKQDKKKISKGHRLFDLAVYGGIAGLGAFVATVPITYWAKYGKGAEFFKRAAKALERTGLSKHAAEDVVMVTALMQGGNVALVPVKIAENNKQAIVENINKAIGEPTDTTAFKEEPKQTWGSLIKARVFMAWLPVFLSFRGAASLFGAAPIDAFEKNFAQHVVCGPLGKPTKINGAETKTFRVGKIIALDVFATTAAATLLYIGSRLFAKKNTSPGNAPAHAETEVIEAVESVLSTPDSARHLAESLASHPEIKKRPASHADAVSAQTASPAMGLSA